MNTPSSENILIIDDNITFTMVLARALKTRGYQVHSAHNSKTALAIAEEYSPDKIILDLKIEQESGLSLIPSLLAILPNVKIVILTGYSSITTAVEAIKLGAINYLCKPADAEQILSAFIAPGNPEINIRDNIPSIERIAWEHIQKVLSANNGNISATARSLGMHRRTLQRKLQKHPVKE